MDAGEFESIHQEQALDSEENINELKKNSMDGNLVSNQGCDGKSELDDVYKKADKTHSVQGMENIDSLEDDLYVKRGRGDIDHSKQDPFIVRKSDSNLPNSSPKPILLLLWDDESIEVGLFFWFFF